MIGRVSVISSKLEARYRPLTGDKGVFAKAPIARHEFLVAFGGMFVTQDSLDELSHHTAVHGIQIEDHLFLVPEELGEADYMNHSCEPNAGLSGQIIVVALRDIAADEEVCYDYAMSDGSDYDEFTCLCLAATCRGTITGADWRIPQLWDTYAGYFSPYIQRRIDQLRQANTSQIQAPAPALRARSLGETSDQ